VESYGEPCTLSRIAEVTVRGDSLVYVKPFDPAQVAYLERKIKRSGLHLAPSNDGRGVLVPIPTGDDD
jgi:ribosome recycling factor